MFENSRNVMVTGGTFINSSSRPATPATPSAIPAFDRLLQATSSSAFYNSEKRFDSLRRHPNTRLKVLEKKINDWTDGINDRNSSVMWVTGEASIGRSAIAQRLADRLSDEGRLLASYFFSRDDPLRNNTSRLIASIAYETALHIPQIKKNIIQALDSNPLIFDLSLRDQFSALITKPICDLARSGYFEWVFAPRVIILDGLNECEDISSQVLILDVIATALRKSLPVLFLISTRPEQHLSMAFASEPMKEFHINLQLSDFEDPADEIQIIDIEQKFLGGLEGQMTKWGMNDVGSEYEVVAVIGSQSSGKSTLLNSLFGTNFAVMDPSSRGRTTIGVWLSRDKRYNVIIMDIEGSNGTSRGDDQQFERKAALFALACSRLLIITIWENQVGQFDNGLLKFVFEKHFSVYGKLDKQFYHRPRILFVIQAHDSRASLESLASKVTLDLNRIWDSIKKPEEMRDRSLHDYIHIDFESITHIVYATPQYQSQVELLRKRFVEKESNNYLLKHALPNAVAADDLELYMKTIWETIRTNENLNLASQHELLAQAMCDKIKTSLLDEYKSRIIAQLEILNQGTVIEGLGLLIGNWKSEILACYDEKARRCIQSVFREKRDEVIHSYHAEVSRLIKVQLRNLRRSLLAKFEAILRDAVSKEDLKFLTITSNAKSRYEDEFTTAARDIAVFDANFYLEHELQELQSRLSQRIKDCREERTGCSPMAQVGARSTNELRRTTRRGI